MIILRNTKVRRVGKLQSDVMLEQVVHIVITRL